MLLVILMFMALLLIGVVSFAYSRFEEDEERARSGSPAGPASADARPRRPESLEGTMAAQLAAGEITRRQYLREMAKVAAREEKRNPLAVPPERGPSGA